MKKLQRLICMLTCCCLATASLSGTAFAATAERTPNVTEKAVIIAEIREKDPDALIFETQEDADAFFQSLNDLNSYTFTETTREISTRATDEEIRDYDITHQLGFATVHLGYSYTVTHGGRFFGTAVGQPYASLSGYTPGTSLDLKSSRVNKISSQELDARFVVYFEYYIVTKPIQVMTELREILISHDIAVGPRVTACNLL